MNGAGNARTERFETIGLYMPAVPTPFAENGDVDVPALESFCDRQIWLGASALVVCGTTGEAPTLTRAEHDQIVRIAGDVARGRKRQSGGTSKPSVCPFCDLSALCGHASIESGQALL